MTNSTYKGSEESKSPKWAASVMTSGFCSRKEEVAGKGCWKGYQVFATNNAKHMQSFDIFLIES